MKRINNKRPSRQPRRVAAPPRVAERMYVGAMKQWSEDFRREVLNEICTSNETQVAELQWYLKNFVLRTDEKKEKKTNWFVTIVSGLGIRVLSGIRKRLGKVPENLARIGQEIATLVKQQTIRVLGTEPERIVVSPQIEGWVRENIQLIRGMQEEQLRKIEQIIEGSIGQTVEDVAKELLKELDITAGRAKFIAIDQVLKLNAQMTREAHRQSGIRRYRWRSREDSKVRSMHRDLAARSAAGETFDYDDPPVSEEDGSRHNPGEGYGCRCYAQPVVEEV